MAGDFLWQAFAVGRVGVLGLLVGTYVGVRHPLWLYWGLAVIMAGLQFARIPGIGLPIYLPLAFGAVVASFVHPRLARSMHPLEFAVLALIITSGLSVVATGFSPTSASLFIRWAIPSLVMLALVQLSSEHLARFGRIFAVVAALNALYGLYCVAFDPTNSSLKYLRVFGYSPEATYARFAYIGQGDTGTVRLGGTWVDPNGAALNLVLALALALLLLVGWQRIVVATVIAVRPDDDAQQGFHVLRRLRVLLVLVFHSMRVRNRAAMIGVIALVSSAAMLAAPVRQRIVASFSGSDVGSAARADALRVFPGQIADHWGFGLGWARPEFIDPEFSYLLNLPSNAPLITLYRGGILVFIAFMAVVVIGCVVAYRVLRSDSTPNAIYGGIFIGICFVQITRPQRGRRAAAGGAVLDIPGIPVYVDRERIDARQRICAHSEPELPGDVVVARL